ncbi:class C sortase [Catenibacterium sp.]|uniref:class C sortase n=1 Tax=Catenibacterium sp. TaxID=2049022 RepID=UPI0039996568
MRKHMATIIAVLVFITGISLLLYPTVSEYWNSLYQSKVVANYSDKMKKMNQKEKQAAIDKAKVYNESLLMNDARFTPTEEQIAEYKSLLNADGLGMMGYIVIPKIHLKLAVSHTVDASVLQVGVGHLEGSSLPVGGNSTHCVLSSHRGLPSAKLFTELDELVEGDIFYLHVYGQVLAYKVDHIATIEPDDYSLFEIEEGKDLCTLFTCTPYGINTQRLVVRGHRISNSLDGVKLNGDAIKINRYIVAICIAIIILCTGYTIRKAVRKIKRRILQNTPS